MKSELDSDGCEGRCIYVRLWCPDCDCERQHLVISKHAAECDECGEIRDRRVREMPQ